MKYNKFLEDLELIDQDHKNFSIETPLRDDAFEMSDDEKISIIQKNVNEILTTLGMDMTDDSLKGPPKRVAKAYVKELFGGLHPKNLPTSSTFDNNITVFSTCEHHLLPIYGKAHVAYFAQDRVVGLSKMNRIVDYYSRRPQVQERLNIQIVKALQKILKTDDVACIIDAKHMCVNSRGIRHIDCSTVTGEFGGKFKDKLTKREFLDYIRK